MTKVKEIKTKVQAASRKMAGVGSPLSKIPSRKGILDVKKQFIIDRYKDKMGPVSGYCSKMQIIYYIAFTTA